MDHGYNSGPERPALPIWYFRYTGSGLGSRVTPAPTVTEYVHRCGGCVETSAICWTSFDPDFASLHTGAQQVVY